MNDTFEQIIKKYNIHPKYDSFIEIPNIVGSNGLARLFSEFNFNLGAEIGVDRGLFSEILCQVNPKLHLFCIDPWQNTVDEKVKSEVPSDQNYFEARYTEAQSRLSSHNCTIIRKNSIDALSDFDDNSLDFVYIHANCDFVNFTNDIHHWTKKVRAGGIISGNDFDNSLYEKNDHVMEALSVYAKSYNISPVFITSTDRKKTIIKSYKGQCCFWVKKPDEDDNKDELTKLAIKYGSDRHPWSKHSYTPYYFELFKDKRESVKKVLEIGVGGEGAGPKMWRDFFPNALIYGADIDEKCIFEDTRIKVYKCNQSDEGDVKNLIRLIGSDVEIVFDDGSHVPQDQLFTCQTIMPMLNTNAIYIIEDVADTSIIEKLNNFDLEIPRLKRRRKRYDDRLIVVRNKKKK